MTDLNDQAKAAAAAANTKVQRFGPKLLALAKTPVPLWTQALVLLGGLVLGTMLGKAT